MMNLIANITLLVAALLDMIVLLGGDIADHRNNGHSNSKYYRWLNKSGEIMSLKRLLLLAVFVGTFTTMALQSWIVVMILAATLLIQGIYLLWRRQWKLLDDGKNARKMLFTAIFIVLCAIFGVGQCALRSSVGTTLFASRVTSMAAVMIAPVTWLLTMLTAWVLRIRPDSDTPEQQDQQD
jgi:CBS domain containing-hemolysin-like protein